MPFTQNPEAVEANPTSACNLGQKRARQRQRNPRSPTSCEPCRISKLRCDRQLPCSTCTRRSNASQCRYSSNRRQGSIPQHATTTAAPSSKQHSDQPAPHVNTDTVTNPTHVGGLADPHVSSEGENYTQARWDALWQRPAPDDKKLTTPVTSSPFGMDSNKSAEELVPLLPPARYCDYLIIQYFTYVAPMFHVLDEQSFQRRYAFFDWNSKDIDLSLIALIFSILSLAIQTLEDNDPILEKVKERIASVSCTSDLVKEFRKLALSCLYADNFMFHFSLTTLESLLLLTYGICHNSGVDAAWTLLGMALNMGIALKCNTSNACQEADGERRRRCWIGILSLHTYQAMLFRDVDLKHLLKTLPPQPATDKGQKSALGPSKSLAGTLIMNIKIEVFRLASRICNKDSIEQNMLGDALDPLDAEISKMRELSSAHFLNAGAPSVLDVTSYAHWCMFEMYAHQLYLHLHRPFCRARSTNDTTPYRPASKWKCITSGAALLEFNQRYLELPRLRQYRWSMFGWNATCTVHGALALASCLLRGDEDGIDLTPYRQVFDAAVDRLGLLQHQSSIYLKAYPILRHIQYVSGRFDTAVLSLGDTDVSKRTIFSTQQGESLATSEVDFGASFDDWMDTIQLFDPTCINWSYWDDIIINDFEAS